LKVMVKWKAAALVAVVDSKPAVQVDWEPVAAITGNVHDSGLKREDCRGGMDGLVVESGAEESKEGAEAGKLYSPARSSIRTTPDLKQQPPDRKDLQAETGVDAKPRLVRKRPRARTGSPL
jgi:hypothetical protein